MKRFIYTLIFSTIILAANASSAFALLPEITIGTLGAGSNRFPVGGTNGSQPSNRYQQVYNASLFSDSINIDSITFFDTHFLSPGEHSIDHGVYEVYLTVTPNAVNGLDTINFDANLGVTVHSFFIGDLGGDFASTELVINGNAFLYDPSLGNLLMDIRVTDSDPNVNPDSRLSLLDAMNGTFGTDSSRAHNFGTGFDSYGLVTRFGGASGSGQNAIPEPSTFFLAGFGLLGLVFGRKLKR